jgi:hypothetical protein
MPGLQSPRTHAVVSVRALIIATVLFALAFSAVARAAG